MSQLMRCSCGGQFVIIPQPQPTGWQCPYCGVLCTVPAVPPQAPPVAPPPVAVRQEVSPSTVPVLLSSPLPRRGSDDYLLYGGIAAIAVLILVVVLNLPVSREAARQPPRKKTLAAAKSVPQQPAVEASARTITPPNTSEPMQRDTLPASDEPSAPVENPVPATEPKSAIPTEVPTAAVTESAPSTVLPDRLTALVKTHCVECHNETEREAGLRMDDLVSQPLREQSARHWHRILQRLQSEEMPPPEKSKLSQGDRTFWVTWLQSELITLAERTPRPSVRRLNRAEYMNTMQAIIGLPPDPTLIIEDVISTGFDTDAAELNLSPQLMRQYVQLARAAAVELRRRNPTLPRLKVKLFGDADSIREASLIREEARRRLQPFAEMAFRRPVEEAKLERLIQIVVEKAGAGKDFDDGMQLAVQAILCSPQFLLITDLNEVSDDFALAAKLSYFLWSAPPDAILLELAEKQALRTGDTLREQVTRMLKDPRSRALADNFGGQWLGTRELGLMQPDEELFPDYTPFVEASLREETHRFFDHVLRQNLGITTFLDADFAFVNEPLSRLYGIPGVRGNELRKVSLNPQQHRGGVLTQGTMLSITSDGVRSSPVIRGVWILENILGDPPAPPPADVPDLESDTRGTKTIREELAKHRQIESCNSCHRKIDPLGFALENYDAIGQWRTHYPTPEKPANAIPVDNKGELPDGTTMVGIAQLKKALLQRKRDFARCLAEKLLAYGCSRKLDFRDEATVEQVVEITEAGGYRFQTLLQAVVQTSAFRGN